MNTEHKDIHKIIPYGEHLRGFANQKFLSNSELHRILKERGIFTLNTEKDFMVPLLQTLLLSPSEFDQIREAFSTKEDNVKVFSREIKWNENIQIYSSDSLIVDVNDFIKQNLPTCTLEQPIRLVPVDNNLNHLRAEFTIKRNDINKSWYEQTNLFFGSFDFINEENGKGRVIISHTAPETKDIALFAVKKQIDQYKKKGKISNDEVLKKIIFKEFSNEERFIFFFRLTNHLECEYFSCDNIKDISMRPEDTILPEEIKWMEDMNKILLSGKSLDKKFFIEENKFHKHLIIWSLESVYIFNFKGVTGHFTVSFGFPDFISSKKENAEFELNISSISPTKSLDTKTRKSLKSQLLSEMDRQKSIVYNNFLNYKERGGE
ncbi:hypothetical protein [Dysgonomonas sp. HGC4]|uniref:GapS4b family protein n=2 Tax=Dysgonomonas sp. HGC4 TaxID=1658009 RepID=UPI001786303B|nr:hypothetical protein [Dysgonomonas sp. HGC4]MBD8347674.1 hypothetical protein [Dysgonomonas sp. HGC4]